MNTIDKIENSFTYHPPKEGQNVRYEKIRQQAKDLAFMIYESVPESRERSIAMGKLEEAVFWANAGIARNE